MNDDFTTAATAEARRESPLYDNEVLSYGVRMAEWARDHLAAQEPTDADTDALTAAERRATRAEAESETRRQQAVYWQERAEGFEARIEHLESTCRVLVKEALDAETARDEYRRGKSEAEARVKHLEDTARVLVKETLNAEAERDSARGYISELETAVQSRNDAIKHRDARIKAVRDVLAHHPYGGPGQEDAIRRALDAP